MIKFNCGFCTKVTCVLLLQENIWKFKLLNLENENIFHIHIIIQIKVFKGIVVNRYARNALGPNKVLGSLGNVIFPPIYLLHPCCMKK